MLASDGWSIDDGGYDLSCGAGGSFSDTGALFITTWKTDNAGISNTTSITLPMV